VFILRDIPEQRIAGFHCKICGRTFTRSYDGNLRIKAHHPTLHTGEQHNLMKTQDEIASLIEMGMRGESNRAIAHNLGWGEKTIRIYWIVLGLEEKVHYAQVQRRTKKKFERRSILRLQIQAILDSLLEQNQEITLRQVSRSLGTNSDYLHSCPDQTEFVRLMIRQHNVRVRQQRDDDVSTQIARSIENLQNSNYIVKVEEIARQVGLSYEQLYNHYPDLRLKIGDAIKKHRTRLKEVQLKNQLDQIDIAAIRLIAQGQRLNYRTILDAAELSPYANKSIPIRDALIRWVSNFAPRD
jgi:DNA-binding IscR family transcriptional regulator